MESVTRMKWMYGLSDAMSHAFVFSGICKKIAKYLIFLLINFLIYRNQRVNQLSIPRLNCEGNILESEFFRHISVENSSFWSRIS